ncbi:hypothetical protein F4819DRAFT_461825 [Hypoxylon fuscum]|nr:hypothetical protein F4819DRAFT_461825 [Hypoxylon fuscum]
MEPSIATNTATAVTVANSEPAAQADAATTSSKEALTKIDAADKLASQPENLVENVSTQRVASETAATDAPSLANGGTKELPKPVTVEEVRDQDMPPTPPAGPTETTGSLPTDESAKDALNADLVPTTIEPDITEATTGDKRKSSEAEPTNGDISVKESSEDAPPDKKQKTNGAATNGAPRKVGRPKKEKKAAAPPVGRTARKTRSQGTVE